jgi:hypothetical protein
MHLTGTFTRFDGYEAICKALVHTDRFDGGSSYEKMYFFDGRHGYRFTTMAAPYSDRFEAVALIVNPVTGLPGFKGRWRGRDL